MHLILRWNISINSYVERNRFTEIFLHEVPIQFLLFVLFSGLDLNPLNAYLNPTCHLLAFLGAHHIFHVSGLRVKN